MILSVATNVIFTYIRVVFCLLLYELYQYISSKFTENRLTLIEKHVMMELMVQKTTYQEGFLFEVL